MKPGDIVGRITSHGRRQIRIASGFYYSSRLAWLYMTGEWPEDQVDHINRIRDDDRWINLRAANQSQNSYNRAWAEESGEWRGIRCCGKQFAACMEVNILVCSRLSTKLKIARDTELKLQAGQFANAKGT